MNKLKLVTTTWKQSHATLTEIRKKVFVDEQRVPKELELDEQDPAAIHFLAYFKNKPVATARILANGHIGRMAVLKPYRNKNIGRQLLEFVIATARQKGMNQLMLNAQLSAKIFYQKAGFIEQGETFMDAGIEHIRMTLRL